MFPAVRAGHEMLAAVLDPADRHFEMTGQPARDQFFGLEQRLAPETAADIGGDHPHLLLFQAEEFRQPGPDQMRHLGRRPHHQLIRTIVPFGEDGAAFHRVHRMTGHAVLALDHDGRAVGDLAEIVIGKGFHHEVAVPVLVNAGRVRRLCRQHVHDRRELFELDLRCLRQILGFGPRIGNTNGNRLAHEADLADRQRRIVRRLVTGHLGRRPHGEHAGHIVGGKNAMLETRRFGNRFYAPMRHGTADEGQFLLAGAPEIAGKFAASREMTRIFLAKDPRANTLAIRCAAVCHGLRPPVDV